MQRQRFKVFEKVLETKSWVIVGKVLGVTSNHKVESFGNRKFVENFREKLSKLFVWQLIEFSTDQMSRGPRFSMIWILPARPNTGGIYSGSKKT